MKAGRTAEGFGAAGLAGFLPEFERMGVIDPLGLSGKEPALIRNPGFAFDRLR